MPRPAWQKPRVLRPALAVPIGVLVLGHVLLYLVWGVADGGGSESGDQWPVAILCVGSGLLLYLVLAGSLGHGEDAACFAFLPIALLICVEILVVIPVLRNAAEKRQAATFQGSLSRYQGVVDSALQNPGLESAELDEGMTIPGKLVVLRKGPIDLAENAGGGVNVEESDAPLGLAHIHVSVAHRIAASTPATVATLAVLEWETTADEAYGEKGGIHRRSWGATLFLIDLSKRRLLGLRSFTGPSLPDSVAVRHGSPRGPADDANSEEVVDYLNTLKVE